MPRRKAVAAAEQPAEIEKVPAPVDTPPTEPLRAGEGAAPDADPTPTDKKPFKEIQERVTSSLAGVEAAEDFRFKQVRLTFPDDRPPTPEEKAEMQSSGFRYRGTNEKAWTARVSPESREKAKELAHKFKEQRLKGPGERTR